VPLIINIKWLKFPASIAVHDFDCLDKQIVKWNWQSEAKAVAKIRRLTANCL